MSILLAVAVLALAALPASIVYAVRALPSYKIDPSGPDSDQSAYRAALEGSANRIDSLDRRLDELTLAVDEGIRRVDRAENRIQKTVTSARRLVREAGLEHAGIEAEYEELQPRDEEPIEPLPAVPEEVGATRTIRVPGGEITIGVRDAAS